MRRIAILYVLLTLGGITCGGDGEDGPSTTPVATPTQGPTATSEAGDTLALLRDGDIWLMKADGHEERRLGLSGVAFFSWASGEELAVVTDAERPKHLLVDLAGGVTELPFGAGGSWSHDGSRYVTSVGEEIVVFDRQGGEVARIRVVPPREEEKPYDCSGTLFNGEPDYVAFGRPVFSPDAKSILVPVNCASLVGANTFFKPVVEVSLDGELIRRFPLRVNFHSQLRFSPDGAHLAVADAFHLSACALRSTLTVADAEGQDSWLLQPAALAELTSPVRTPQRTPRPVAHRGIIGFDWSPASDGAVAAVAVQLCPSAGQEPEREPFLEGLYFLSLDGSEELLLEGPASAPAWSPSGRSVAFETGYGIGQPREDAVVRVLDLRTREVADLGRGTAPSWRPAPP